MSRFLHNWTFWTAISLLILTDILFIGTILEYFNFSSVIGQYRLNHWTGWIGIIFIAIHIPIFVWAKRKYSKKIRTFLTIHVIGMLSSYLLITIHFASQISRPAEFYPDLGTGVAQYLFMIILIITGFLQRFNLLSKHRKKWLFLHRSSIFALLIIIVFHILHGI
jgi:hypothetical protein